MPQTAGIPATQLGYTKLTTVVPSDSALAPVGTKSLYIGTTGNVTVLMRGAATPFTFTAVPAGAELAISPAKIMATGTTATNIVAMG
jgi:hypothetical protein